MPILVALASAPRIVVSVEDRRVALLARRRRLVVFSAEESLEKSHGTALPGRRYT